ncbi:hypothetical protein LCGC14_0323090 [marine sediment metagenome]|uniref:HTH psq-type domain-containing protein n=1 Tax=marine sediment metagenome TaxID=412755 RepID=A0A0F9TIJ9_9ZZZZ
MAARTRVILNDAQRKEVKSMWAKGKGMSKKDLATKFTVSTSTIANILGPAPGSMSGKRRRAAATPVTKLHPMITLFDEHGRLFVPANRVATYLV